MYIGTQLSPLADLAWCIPWQWYTFLTHQPVHANDYNIVCQYTTFCWNPPWRSSAYPTWNAACPSHNEAKAKAKAFFSFANSDKLQLSVKTMEWSIWSCQSTKDFWAFTKISNHFYKLSEDRPNVIYKCLLTFSKKFWRFATISEDFSILYHMYQLVHVADYHNYINV